MNPKTRVLIISQEMSPYLGEGSMATITNKLPQYLLEHSAELRLLMPRFSGINERRHKLHEVVRLSGINIIIDEDDYPLLIKVASLPGARLQVYFLDSDEFFKRKGVFHDEKGKLFADSSERMIFFCKGVLETVRKFGWSPDIIHCHGWMTSLIPLYIKTVYKNDPIFANAQTIYSVYPNNFDEAIDKNFYQKAPIKRVDAELLAPYDGLTNNSLHKGAIHYADGVIQPQPDIDPEIAALIEGITDKYVIKHTLEDEYLPMYKEMYGKILGQGEVEEVKLL